MAYGECAILYVGGVFERNETLTVGEALVNALKSESKATSGGQVIVSETCFKYVNEEFYRGTLVRSSDDDDDRMKYYKLDLKFRGQRVKVKADVLKMLTQFDIFDLQRA